MKLAPSVIYLIAFGTLVLALFARASGPQDRCERLFKGDRLELKDGENQMPAKSEMMDALYGRDVADNVYARLQSLDPVLNEEIQRIAYDHFWARPGLSTRDKSLVTVASLISLGREEQIKIHINGFFGAGGTVEEIKYALIQLAASANQAAALNGLEGLKDVLTQRRVAKTTIETLSIEVERAIRSFSYSELWEIPGLSVRDKSLIDISAAVAIGKQADTREAITRYLSDGGKLEELRNIFIHQIVYCGFPAAMSAFAVLQDVMRTLTPSR